jgi:hypothetical protein
VIQIRDMKDSSPLTYKAKEQTGAMSLQEEEGF